MQKITREQTHVITLHPRSGCSAGAIRGGHSVDTSMGKTPLEGLVMGTRSGDLDPAIIDLIASKEGLSTHDVESLLNTQSGLMGISGLTNDMKFLEQELREHDDRRVRLAIEVFCHRARKYIGAYLASMGGADAVVFTGGIGENSADIRSRICAGLEWAGLTIDATQNQQTVGHESRISTEDRGCKPGSFLRRGTPDRARYSSLRFGRTASVRKWSRRDAQARHKASARADKPTRI